MPLIHVRTSKDIDPKEDLLLILSQSLAKLTGKPESYVMVILDTNALISFGASLEPSAFVEVKSIGSLYPKELSKEICSILENNLDIPPNRIYINFEDINASNWGYNSSTFG